MIWSIVLSAVGLLLIFEGVLPFLSPSLWRRIMQHMLVQSDRTLHIIGLISMLIGLTLICIARDLY